MKTILVALQEIYGLFVEDGSLAVGALVWVVIAGWLVPHSGLPEQYRAPLLFGGLCVLLLENVYRSAVKRRRPGK